MIPPGRLQPRRLGLLLSILTCGLAQLTLPGAAGADDGMTELAVSSVVMPDYVRHKLADGSFEPESYVFGRGGRMEPDSRDDTFDLIRFKDVVDITCHSLVKQNYVAATDPAHARLLIRIYWGSTQGGNPVSSRRRNAMLMGYEAVLSKYYFERYARPSFHLGDDLMEELQDGTEMQGGRYGRYFVIVVAFDYQLMRERKIERPLWMTRFSINGRRVAFNEQLPIMTMAAARYFGQPTNGLTHQDLPSGRVELGEMKVLGTAP